MIFYDFFAFALFSSLSERRNMGGVGSGCFVFGILVTVFFMFNTVAIRSIAYLVYALGFYLIHSLVPVLRLGASSTEVFKT